MWIDADEEASVHGREQLDVGEDVVRGQRRHRDVPLFFGQISHRVDRPATQEESMVATEGLVARDVAVKPEIYGVLVERGEVVGLSESVDCQLPVAGDVVVVVIGNHELVEFPRLEFVGEFTGEQLVDVDDASWIRVHKEESVHLDRRQPNETVARHVDLAEVVVFG